MKVFTNNCVNGLYPVGACAIAVAETLDEAVKQMELALEKSGIAQKVEPTEMVELDLTVPNAVVLLNGDY